MSDTEGSECEGCRWTRNEMARLRDEPARLRNELAKANEEIEVLLLKLAWNEYYLGRKETK